MLSLCIATHFSGVHVRLILQFVDQCCGSWVGWPDTKLVLQQQLLFKLGILLPQFINRGPANRVTLLLKGCSCVAWLCMSCQLALLLTSASPLQTCETRSPTS